MADFFIKAINDTLIEVKFGKELSADFVREAERSGKYFVVYTEGETVQGNSVQSKTINFSSDRKTAQFSLDSAIESGKKYNVALIDGDNKQVAEILYTYGPAELKEAAKTPEFEVSAVADKIFVKYNTKMKDSAKEFKNYKVYDEGGQFLGDLKDFVDPIKVENGSDLEEGKWVNLNEKREVEFKLSKDDDKKKLLAGKKYKLLVSQDVKTDDNKTLAENKRTITITTPSVEKASPKAAVARVVDETTLEIVFDQDIAKKDNKDITINPAQLDLRTSTGKTVQVDQVSATIKDGTNNTLVLEITEGTKLEKGTTYKVDIPANIVQNSVFANAMNKATTGLEAKAQDNVAIASMKAQIVANAKNTGQADLILTFDQVPNLEDLDKQEIVLFDNRDKYILDANAVVKTFGGDTSGKSIIIEDISQYKHDGKGNLVVRGDKTYDIEIATGKLATNAFGDVTQATNKSKLKASTKGLSISKPVVDEVVLDSASQFTIFFKEDIKGNIKPADVELSAYISDKSDIFTDAELSLKVSGSGYFETKIEGKKLVIKAKDGVKFPTSADALAFEIKGDAITNVSGSLGNDILTNEDVDKGDFVDNAAPEIVNVQLDKANTAIVTYTEAVEIQGKNKDEFSKEIASLFFTDKGENATEGVAYEPENPTDGKHTSATITFKERVWKDSTDLSVVTLKHTKGNTYFMQDEAGNKMATHTIKGVVTATNADSDEEVAVEGATGVKATNVSFTDGEDSVPATSAVYTLPIEGNEFGAGDVVVVMPDGTTIEITLTDEDATTAEKVAEKVAKVTFTGYDVEASGDEVIFTSQSTGKVEDSADQFSIKDKLTTTSILNTTTSTFVDGKAEVPATNATHKATIEVAGNETKAGKIKVTVGSSSVDVEIAAGLNAVGVAQAIAGKTFSGYTVQADGVTLTFTATTEGPATDKNTVKIEEVK